MPRCRKIGPSSTPAYQPTNAATSIVPSMPMLTTPERSHMTPHRAAKPNGTAARKMAGANTTTTSMSQPTSWKKSPATGMS